MNNSSLKNSAYLRTINYKDNKNHKNSNNFTKLGDYDSIPLKKRKVLMGMGINLSRDKKNKI